MGSTKSIEKLDAQAASLRWLARAFWNTPDQTWLEAFDDDALQTAGVSASIVVRLADEVSNAGENFLQDAAVDYTSLFASSSLSAPHPYESIYFGSARQMMQGCRDDVLLRYQAAGFDGEAVQSPGINEPEDHLSCELCFLAYLLESAADAKDDKERNLYLEEAKRFVEEHLGTWIAPFASEVYEQAETELYKAVAESVTTLIGAIG